jgi:hypothetical protein
MMAETFQGNTAWEFPFATRCIFVSQPGLAVEADSRPCCCGTRNGIDSGDICTDRYLGMVIAITIPTFNGGIAGS